jgi:hypothetical protein
MELEDLKHSWKKNEIKTNKNLEIMELIQRKNYGPLAKLKKAFLKEIRMMAVIPFILVLTNLNDLNAVFTSIMFWSYVVFCIGVVAFSVYNYRLVDRIERMDEIVKSNLVRQIHLLETRLKWNMIGVRFALLFFILLTEIIPYFQHYRILDLWHSLNPIIRFGAYAGLLILQYFVSRSLCKRKFGHHILYLKELVKEV